MSQPSDPLLPLPNDIAEFVRLEREFPEPPVELQDAIFSRLQGTLGLLHGDVTGSDQPTLPNTTSHGAPGIPSSGGASDLVDSAGKALWASRPLLRTVVAFVVGSGVGAGVHQVFDVAAQRRAAMSTPPSPSPPSSAPSPDEGTQAAPPPPLPPVPGPIAPLESRPQSGAAKSLRSPQGESRKRDRDLGAERGLIEQARTALSRGKGDVALAALERHARAHPQGALEEERESLLVQALVTSDRLAEARNVAARFRSRFPRSIFAPVVEEALRSIP